MNLPFDGRFWTPAYAAPCLTDGSRGGSVKESGGFKLKWRRRLAVAIGVTQGVNG
jgi:hypothetical protein